jgi:hypothetical protein
MAAELHCYTSTGCPMDMQRRQLWRWSAAAMQPCAPRAVALRSLKMVPPLTPPPPPPLRIALLLPLLHTGLLNRKSVPEITVIPWQPPERHELLLCHHSPHSLITFMPADGEQRRGAARSCRLTESLGEQRRGAARSCRLTESLGEQRRGAAAACAVRQLCHAAVWRLF